MDDEYHLIARIYDPLLEPLLGPVRQVVAGLARERGWRRVLDVGGGTGRQCEALMRQGVGCLLVDQSPAMLRQATATVLRARGDAAALPLADASVDAAIFSLCLHEMAHPLRLAALAEAGRVARAVVVADYAGDAGPAGHVSIWSPGLLLAHVPERLAGRRHYRMFRDFLARGGAAGVLQAAGYHLVTRRPMLQGALAVILAELPREPGVAGVSRESRRSMRKDGSF